MSSGSSFHRFATSRPWLMFRGEADGRPVTARVRAELAGHASRSEYPHCFSVSYLFGEPEDARVPTAAEEKKLQQFEERLVKALEAEGGAVLVAVVTWDCNRDWVFYCLDMDITGERLNDTFAADAELPLEVTGLEDPEWTGFAAIHDGFLGDAESEIAGSERHDTGGGRAGASAEPPQPTDDPAEAKRQSEAIVQAAEGRTCDWLPIMEFPSRVRTSKEAACRVLVLNAMVQLAFNAPRAVIARWVVDNKLEDELTPQERRVLLQKKPGIAPDDQAMLMRGIESIWALVWVGGLIPGLPFDRPVEDRMASLLPNLQRNEPAAGFVRRFTSRDPKEVFSMRDLYYRVHWWTTDAMLKGEETGEVDGGWVACRRKSLEWVLDVKTAWDDVDLST